MSRMLSPGLILRLVIVGSCIAFSGIAPQPHLVVSSLAEARQAMQSRAYANASAALAQAAVQLPWRTDLWDSAGRQAFQAGDFAPARAHLQRAAAAGGLSPAGYLVLGDILQESGDLSTALPYWQQALQSGGPAEELYLRLAAAYRQSGQYSQSAANLQALTRLQPADASLHYQIGLLFAATDPEASLAYLSRAAELDPSLAASTQALQRSLTSARWVDDPSYTFLAAGRALAALDEWELAAEAFRRAVQARPEYSEAWAYLGEALQHSAGGSSGDHNQPASTLTAASPGSPASPAAAPHAGFKELQTAYHLDSTSIAANTFLALYYQRQVRYDLALVHLNIAVGLEPDNPALQAEIGNNFALMGDLSAAQRCYEKATRLAPRDPLYWRLLASFSTVHEVQVRTLGLPAARQAVLLDPSDPASLDLMAQVFILLNDPYSAERFLQRALAADPRYAPAHLHLGVVLLLAGKSKLALYQLEQAQELAGSSSLIAEQARRLLQNLTP